jgi:hypothetical protein
MDDMAGDLASCSKAGQMMAMRRGGAVPVLRAMLKRGGEQSIGGTDGR